MAVKTIEELQAENIDLTNQIETLSKRHEEVLKEREERIKSLERANTRLMDNVTMTKVVEEVEEEPHEDFETFINKKLGGK